MNRVIHTTADVVAWRLCLGCGACAYICPEDKIRLVDFASEGIRPVLCNTDCGDCTLCLQVCPAVQADFSLPNRATVPPVTGRFEKEWGPILEVWEGHAADPELRFRGSSGGALTAISAYCLQKAGMHGVLHIGQDDTDPARNRTRLSRSREDLLAATGSRYSPASVCNGLGLVEKAPGPCVIIGKPAEIAAVRNAQRLRQALEKKIGLTLSFFCAETPSTQGTLALLEKMGVPASNLATLQYRGEGWPGHFAPVIKGNTVPSVKMTYKESWGFLQAFRPWSVQLWPDSSGELADISCGDPWYTTPDGVNPGSSLVVVRTQRGREILNAALRDGCLILTPAETWKLERSQRGLLKKKGSVWGRRLSLRLLGLPVTRFKGNHLFHCWLRLNTIEKLRSVLGTVRRILRRKFLKPLDLSASDSRTCGTPKECVVTPALSRDVNQSD